MVATAVINYIMAFVMTVTIMSTLGDVESILTTTTGQPYIQVVLNATQSRVGTSIMTALVAVILVFSAVNLVTTSSRQLFAFARDKGLPFSSFLAYVCHFISPTRLSTNSRRRCAPVGTFLSMQSSPLFSSPQYSVSSSSAQPSPSTLLYRSAKLARSALIFLPSRA